MGSKAYDKYCEAAELEYFEELAEERANEEYQTRLIAAAPELLEALEERVAAYDMWALLVPDVAHRQPEAEIWVNKARQAIAKVKRELK